LKRGIRIAGLVTPGDDEQDDFDETEGEAILESLREVSWVRTTPATSRSQPPAEAPALDRH
jgi:hypothetical protein